MPGPRAKAAARGGLVSRGEILQAQAAQVAAAQAGHDRLVRAEIDHGGGLGGARAGIHHRLQRALEALADFVRVVQRLAFAGRDQRRGQQRRAEDGQQLLRHAVIGHAQRRAGGFVEPPIVTSGDDLATIARFLEGRTRYTASDVVAYLLSTG